VCHHKENFFHPKQQREVAFLTWVERLVDNINELRVVGDSPSVGLKPKETPLFFEFSYVCPELVLAK
jgi:hypothetical protein